MAVTVLPVAVAARRTLLVTSAIHITNDACFALLYPLLPFIAADLHLSYTQIGMVKASFSSASSVLQIPVGVLGERYGEALILLLGNIWVGLGLVLMAVSGGYALLLLTALVAGIGGNAQHPLAAAIVSRAFVRARRATALGTLNFTGDLGKMIGPLVVGVIAVRWGWRLALVSVGGVTAAVTVPLLIGRRGAAAGGCVGRRKERRGNPHGDAARLPLPARRRCARLRDAWRGPDLSPLYLHP